MLTRPPLGRDGGQRAKAQLNKNQNDQGVRWQYQAIKAELPDTLVFNLMGGFYELS
jgi:hypothetical protein